MKPRGAWGAATLALIAAALLALPGAARAGVTTSCTLILEPESGAWLHRDGDCQTRRAPFSSFKLPLAAIGFDAGILEDTARPAWAYQNGFTLNMPTDTGVITPVLWEKLSVVWYSQEITKRLGAGRLAGYLKRLGYGNMDVTGRAHVSGPARAPGPADSAGALGGAGGVEGAAAAETGDGLMNAWLGTSLLISPEEQAMFLRRFQRRELRLLPSAYGWTERILPRFEAAADTANAARWTLTGKTGSGFLPGPDGAPDRSRPQGWFVGWADRDTQGGKFLPRRVIFVRWVAGEQPFDGYGGPVARETLIADWPRLISNPAR